MTITNLMHVTGSKADLYSSSYFEKVEGERPAVNPFTRWVDGKLFACGTVVDKLGKGRVVIDLTAAREVMFISADSDDPMSEMKHALLLMKQLPRHSLSITRLFHLPIRSSVGSTDLRTKSISSIIGK